MALSQLSFAAIKEKLENNIALVNLNFDFSLVTVTPPEEYGPLGKALSPLRREQAEEGSTHQTARRLGALFDSVVRPGDDLVKAYGQRVSEISTLLNTEAESSRRPGCFERHAGADGTAIWAAATSGKSAIAIVLLACMLARLWDSPKATAIWVELVEGRQRQIIETYDKDEPSHLSLKRAADQKISRKELAEWDSSARAWLQVADRVKAAEHQRMESVLLSLSLPVDNSDDVFTSVLRAWSTAMTALDNLIKGMPQRVHNSAALIAISAWHIYPDIDLFGSKPRLMQQKDSLVHRGGRLTLGLEDADPLSSQGVYWSLSLAKLNYYGDPVHTTRHRMDESRVSFSEFTLVALGSLFSAWANPAFDPHFDQLDGAKFITALWGVLGAIRTNTGTLMGESTKVLIDDILSPRGWLSLLTMAAETLLDERSEESKRAQKLVSLGVRRGRTFLQGRRGPTFLQGDLASECPTPFFGLTNPSVLVALLQDNEARVDTLRVITQKLALGSRYEKGIIRYYNDATQNVEYATAIPLHRSYKRGHAGNVKTVNRHRRWIGRNPLLPGIELCCACTMDCAFQSCACAGRGRLCSRTCGARQWHDLCLNTRQSKIRAQGEDCEEFDPATTQCTLDHATINWYERLDNHMVQNHGVTDQEGWAPSTYVYLFGDVENAALFVPGGSKGSNGRDIDLVLKTAPSLLTADALTSLLSSRFSEAMLVDHLANWNMDMQFRQHTSFDVNMRNDMIIPTSFVSPLEAGYSFTKRTAFRDSLITSLHALATVARVYAMLPDATIALSVLENRLWDSKWTRSLLSGDVSLFNPSGRLSLARALSCVAMFETGALDMDPQELGTAFAISSGSSIFAAASLLVDPLERCEEYELRQIVGNVGRAGTSMLISPENPVFRKSAIDKWQTINHAAFTLGEQCIDYFDKTSLHLSLTGYEAPIMSAAHHSADLAKAAYLEAPITVYDGGERVGEIDILGALKSLNLHRVLHPENGCHHDLEAAGFQARWTCIDSWNELLEIPRGGISIVRAHKNSIARLAIASACIQRRIGKCHILDPSACYFCVQEDLGERGGAVLVC
ncbi:hypothetical protein GGS20DRAFT_199952 [Poronia punctata]|nr:hypothetical protein GGS20DRAFT_199952 [Poronia punctata]